MNGITKERQGGVSRNMLFPETLDFDISVSKAYNNDKGKLISDVSYRSKPISDDNYALRSIFSNDQGVEKVDQETGDVVLEDWIVKSCYYFIPYPNNTQYKHRLRLEERFHVETGETQFAIAHNFHLQWNQKEKSDTDIIDACEYIIGDDLCRDIASKVLSIVEPDHLAFGISTKLLDVWTAEQNNKLGECNDIRMDRHYVRVSCEYFDPMKVWVSIDAKKYTPGDDNYEFNCSCDLKYGDHKLKNEFINQFPMRGATVIDSEGTENTRYYTVDMAHLTESFFLNKKVHSSSIDYCKEYSLEISGSFNIKAKDFIQEMPFMKLKSMTRDGLPKVILHHIFTMLDYRSRASGWNIDTKELKSLRARELAKIDMSVYPDEVPLEEVTFDLIDYYYDDDDDSTDSERWQEVLSSQSSWLPSIPAD